MTFIDQIHNPSSGVPDLDIVLYLPLWKKDGDSFLSDDKTGYLCTVTDAERDITGRVFNPGEYIDTPDLGIDPATDTYTLVEVIDDEVRVIVSDAGSKTYYIDNVEVDEFTPAYSFSDDRIGAA